MPEKRPREDSDDDETSGAIVEVKRAKTDLVVAEKTGPPRTSSLMAPIMLLTGHSAEVMSVKFNAEGNRLASGGMDKEIRIWETNGECANTRILKGHTNAILELHWSTDSSQIFTASADRTCGVWDPNTGKRVRRLKEHESYVHTCAPTRRGVQQLVSGSDDCTARLWDVRQKNSIDILEHDFPVTATSFSDDGTTIFTGGLENEIFAWDLRKLDVAFSMKGHGETLTGFALSADGSYLLSNSMDSTLRVWDVRPYAPPTRCVKIFEGAQHNFEKNLIKCAWAPDGQKVAAGSSDRCVYIWDTTSRKILYKLPGHSGSVNDVHFHPKEPIIASCGSDKQIYLGEFA